MSLVGLENHAQLVEKYCLFVHCYVGKSQGKRSDVLHFFIINLNKFSLKLNFPIDLDNGDIILIDLRVVITGNVSLDDPSSLFLLVHEVPVVFSHHRLPTGFHPAMGGGYDPILYRKILFCRK